MTLRMTNEPLRGSTLLSEHNCSQSLSMVLEAFQMAIRSQLGNSNITAPIREIFRTISVRSSVTAC